MGILSRSVRDVRTAQRYVGGTGGLIAAMLGAAAMGIDLGPSGSGYRRFKGPIELAMESAAIVKRKARGAKGIFSTYRGNGGRDVSVSGQLVTANVNKRARKAAGVVGRKASKRFYRQFKRDGSTGFTTLNEAAA